MLKLEQLCSDISEEVKAVREWAEELYQKYFGPYFTNQNELYKSLQSTSRPISDTELEEVLTSLPLELFKVSEALSEFKIGKEVVSLKAKQKESEIVKCSTASTITAKKEEAASDDDVIQFKLVQTVYSSIITRVENEMAFSRELIMSAKKIWDSRKDTMNSNPVGNVVPEESTLPDYVYNSTPSSSKTYIK